VFMTLQPLLCQNQIHRPTHTALPQNPVVLWLGISFFWISPGVSTRTGNSTSIKSQGKESVPIRTESLSPFWPGTSKVLVWWIRI
jgi:hypothetical protein